MNNYFPFIDVQATGKNIKRLRQERNLSVKDLQNYFGFEEPQAIYKWQWGQCLPSVDNLFALCYLLDVKFEDILVAKNPIEPQETLGFTAKRQANSMANGLANGRVA